MRQYEKKQITEKKSCVTAHTLVFTHFGRDAFKIFFISETRHYENIFLTAEM